MDHLRYMESRETLRNRAVYHKLTGMRGPAIAAELGLSKEQFRDLFKPDAVRRVCAPPVGAPKPKRRAASANKRPELTLRHKVSAFLTRAGFAAPFTEADVVARFGPNPVCYLTGIAIDYNDPKAYQLDHFLPVSKGGTSDFDNLRIATPWANMMKNGTPHGLFIERCKAIVDHSVKCS